MSNTFAQSQSQLRMLLQSEARTTDPEPGNCCNTKATTGHCCQDVWNLQGKHDHAKASSRHPRIQKDVDEEDQVEPVTTHVIAEVLTNWHTERCSCWCRHSFLKYDPEPGTIAAGTADQFAARKRRCIRRWRSFWNTPEELLKSCFGGQWKHSAWRAARLCGATT